MYFLVLTWAPLLDLPTPCILAHCYIVMTLRRFTITHAEREDGHAKLVVMYAQYYSGEAATRV